MPLEGVKSQLLTFPPRVHVHQREEHEHDDDAERVEHHQRHDLRCLDLYATPGPAAESDERIEHQREHELERVDVKHHYEQQQRVEHDSGEVVHSIAAKEHVVYIPCASISSFPPNALRITVSAPGVRETACGSPGFWFRRAFRSRSARPRPAPGVAQSRG